MSVAQPEIDTLLSKVDSKFTLCTLSSKRARQINDMIHGARDQALNVMAYSEISKLQSAKPLSLSMEEIAKGDVAAILSSDTDDESDPDLDPETIAEAFEPDQELVDEL
ncbi:MAG: DNA-directed RNA polymerase subunit omega [Coriobacteriia bacterium]|nr:DNA-directed RNA polymerase subunit omega [Coriobacteriia bacterium]